MENKCLVCGAIIPEGRQVCPTCKKGGKHEISKKLTDEEIIKAYFEDCNEDFCHTCPLSETDCCAEILDLIHRLQRENAEQKAEIERLTEENEQSKNMYEDIRKCNEILLKERNELQKQVDKAWFEVGKMCMEERKDTAKEILQELWDETEPLNESHKWVRLRIKNIASRKGVEVE